MKNILFFSDYIKPAAQKIRFTFVVIGRFFKILFRRKKDIKLLQLEYAKEYQFNNSFLIIHYDFKNTLWYNFKKIRKTTKKGTIILNLKNIPEMPVELVVHGFFRRKVLQISVIAEYKIETKSFRTELKSLNKIKNQTKSLRINNLNFVPAVPKIKTKNTTVQINYPKIKIEQPLFNQNDFL